MTTLPEIGEGAAQQPAPQPAPAAPPPQPAAARPPEPRAKAPSIKNVLSLSAQTDPEQHAKMLRIAEGRGIPRSLVEAALESGTATDRALVENDYARMLNGLPRTQAWLTDPDTARAAHDDVELVAQLGRHLEGFRTSRGIVGEGLSRTGNGFIQLQASYGFLRAALGVGTEDENADLVASAQQAITARNARTPAGYSAFQRRFQRAEGLDILLTALSNPVDTGVLVAENLGFASPSLVLGGAGAVAGPIGAGIGAAAGGSLAEFGGYVQQRVGEAGYDLNDPAQVSAALRDGELMADINAAAVRFSLGVGVVDGLSGFFGGKLLSGAGRGVGAKAVAAAGELGVQSVGEGAGQYVGDLLATGEGDTNEALREMVSSGGQSAGRIAIGTASRRGFEVSAKVAHKVSQAQQDAKVIREAIGAYAETKTFKRLPARLRKLVASSLRTEEGGEAAIEFDRGAWDGYWREQGESPVEKATEVGGPSLAKDYHEAAATGFFTIPADAFIDGLANAQEHIEGLVPLARMRPDSVSEAEAEILTAEIEQAIAGEAQAEGETTLFQQEHTLRKRLAEVEEAIQAAEGQEQTDLDTSGRSQASPDTSDGLDTSDGTDKTDTTPALADLHAERAALVEQLQGIEDAAEAAQGAEDQLKERTVAQLVEAGQSEATAQTSALPFVAAFRTLSDRTGIPLADLVERFPVTIQRATGKLAAGALEQETKGGTSFGQPDDQGRRPFTIEFLSRANRSTFLHEAAHVFLEIMGDLVAEGAGGTLAADYQEVRSWLGIEEGAAISRQQHERFARGFEAYLLEGKAPSPALTRAFANFRAWLVRIYKNLLGLEEAAGQPINLSDEVREVFDRLLATDEEIAATEYAAETGQLPEEFLAGLDDETRAAYQEAVQRAQDAATAELDAVRFKALEDEKRALRGERLAHHKAQALQEIAASPAGQALAAVADAKINRASIQEVLGDDERVAQLDKRDLLSDEGEDANAVAEAFGFGSLDALADALLRAADPEPIAAQMARERLRAEMALDGTLKPQRQQIKDAEKAVASAERARLLETELELVRKASRERSRAEAAERTAEKGEEAAQRRALIDLLPKLPAVRARAERTLAIMPLRQIVPHRYLSAAKRESTRAKERIRVGDVDGYAQARGREMLNHELFRIATGMQEQASKDARYLRSTTSGARASHLTKPQNGAREQVYALLERYGLGRFSPADTRRKEALSDWVKARDEEGLVLAIPDFLLRDDRARPYTDLTAAELHGFREFVEGVVHIGREHDKVLTGDKRLTRDGEAEELIDAARESAGGRQRREEHDDPSAGERLATFFEGIVGLGTKASIFARILDGDRDGGAWWRHLIKRVNDGTDVVSERWRAMIERYRDLYLEHFDTETLKGIFNPKLSRRDYAGASLSHEERLGVLSHMGHVEGRQRLSERFSEAQIEAVLAASTEADAAFVKARWELLESLWPEIVAQQERVTGQRPVKVEAVGYEVTTADGTKIEMPGGYHPLMYSERKRFAERARDFFDGAIQGRAPSAMMRLGFNKERKPKVSGRVRLDRGVTVKHLHDVIHALGMREAVLDVQALLRRQDVRDVLLETHGPRALPMLEGWLERVASGGVQDMNELDKLSRWFRQGSVTALIGLRLKTALLQFYGLRQAVVRIGPQWTMAGLRHVASNWSTAADEATRLSPFMRERTKGSWHRELAEVGQTLRSKGAELREATLFLFVAKSQFAVDLVTWYGQYERAMAAASPDADPAALEAEAVAQADQAVKDSQSGGQPVDLSFFEGAGPVVRLFTTFFTEAGLKLNLTRLSKSRTRWNNPASVAHFLSDMFLLYFFEAAVFGIATAVAASSDGEDSEEAARRGLGVFTRRGLSALADTFPMLRELTGPIQGFPYRGPAGIYPLNASINAAQQIGQGEADAAFWKAVNSFGGAVLHYPSGAFNEYGEAVMQVLEGEVPTALLGANPD